MPRIKTLRTKKPPEGFEEIEDVLEEFSNKMKDAQEESSESRSKQAALWPIFQISHQRSRYIYNMYYEKEAISSPLYQWLLKQGYADGMLIAKWKKQGYEKLCCLRCIQARESNFQTTCICRVPKAKLTKGTVVECVNCGCRGCASTD